MTQACITPFCETVSLGVIGDSTILVRIRRLTPYLANGKVRFKRDSPSARLLVEQLRDFPHGDHDDGPDAFEMSARLAADLLNRPAEPELPLEEIVIA